MLFKPQDTSTIWIKLLLYLFHGIYKNLYHSLLSLFIYQSVLKEISPEYSLELLMLKLKLQYLATCYEELTHWKRPCCWGRRQQRVEMVEWHHRLDGHESEQALGDGDGQGGLACCSPWGRKESDTTE